MGKKILVTKSSLPPLDEYIDEIRDLWDSSILTNMGVKHKEFEQRLQKYMDVDNISLMVNGHMALELLLQALKLTGEVITTPFTFASTTHAIVRNGLTPIFCDIEADTYTLDADKIENLITPKTSAILPVHVYGNVCDVEKIERIAKRHNLKVVYDAAHAFGVTYKGQGIGRYGDASMFSFHATKVFHSIEGGAVCFRDSKLATDLYGLKNFGIRGPEIVDFVGANAKMNEFQAAMGICNLRYVNRDIRKRESIYKRYKERLEHIAGIQLIHYRQYLKSNYAYFPIVVHKREFGATREQLFERLALHDIFCRKYFFPLTSDYDCYKNRFIQPATPVASFISDNVLALPMYADLELDDVDRICSIIVNSGANRYD